MRETETQGSFIVVHISHGRITAGPGPLGYSRAVARKEDIGKEVPPDAEEAWALRLAKSYMKSYAMAGETLSDIVYKLLHRRLASLDESAKSE